MPFTPGSPSSLPTHIKADIHIQPSKTSVSASAQGQRAAGDERGFRTPTSASARRSGRPSRHSPARLARLFLGRQVGGEAGGVKFLQPIKGRSIGILCTPRIIHQELYIARVRALFIQYAAAPRQFHSVSRQQFSFVCPPTIHKAENKIWKCRTVSFSSI